MTPLSDQDIEARLVGSAWSRQGDAVVREYKLADFAAAIAFVNRVAELAERANHHPDILVHGWNRVRLELSTHSAGGLTAADFALAEEIDRLGPT
ncbi:MAG TPA: 4a-hydroxytetrahydrobiopterin dehydratase [Solirubrobacteraceae bacterium]|nr:4a-hydroxytetrahydrobiopterin dehydratase [Solirubrobacteraceae bacterium]